VPKIDWSDDDYPRWEPRYRPSRDRARRFSLRPTSPADLPLLFRQAYVSQDTPPARRPLHLIWGEPNRTLDS
jgi:hypothetical protein